MKHVGIKQSAAAEQSVVDAQAGQWLAQLHSGVMTSQDRAGFEAWLAADGKHPLAYRNAEQIWRDLSLINALGDIDIKAPTVMQRLLSRPVLAAAASVLVAIVLAVAFLRPDGNRYSTAVAQIRELDLPDGSRVVLGARSTLRWDFTDERRRVVLTSGEAYFSIAKDATRPFHVLAGDTLVRVLGTEFDVRHGAQGVRVAVSEGSVEVMPAAEHSSPSTAASSRRVLTAGQEIVASQASFTVQQIAGPEPGAWRSGRLSYENATLAEVITDANRYSDREIIFADGSLREVRVTTAFRTDQVEQMLASLAATHPITIDRNPNGRIILNRQR